MDPSTSVTLLPTYWPMLLHVLWATTLYALLTACRAPSVWGIGASGGLADACAKLEPRVTANLKNQFEWPQLFYVACILGIVSDVASHPFFASMTWLFVIGRLVHSAVHILTNNIRLRGVVFTINFIAVLGMWTHLGFSEHVLR